MNKTLLLTGASVAILAVAAVVAARRADAEESNKLGDVGPLGGHDSQKTADGALGSVITMIGRLLPMPQLRRQMPDRGVDNGAGSNMALAA